MCARNLSRRRLRLRHSYARMLGWGNTRGKTNSELELVLGGVAGAAFLCSCLLLKVGAEIHVLERIEQLLAIFPHDFEREKRRIEGSKDGAEAVKSGEKKRKEKWRGEKKDVSCQCIVGAALAHSHKPEESSNANKYFHPKTYPHRRS